MNVQYNDIDQLMDSMSGYAYIIQRNAIFRNIKLDSLIRNESLFPRSSHEADGKVWFYRDEWADNSQFDALSKIVTGEMVGIVVRYMLIASMLFRDKKEENMRFSQSVKAEL